jgi:hypothetical protein
MPESLVLIERKRDSQFKNFRKYHLIPGLSWAVNNMDLLKKAHKKACRAAHPDKGWQQSIDGVSQGEILGNGNRRVIYHGRWQLLSSRTSTHSLR